MCHSVMTGSVTAELRENAPLHCLPQLKYKTLLLLFPSALALICQIFLSTIPTSSLVALVIRDLGLMRQEAHQTSPT